MSQREDHPLSWPWVSTVTRVLGTHASTDPALALGPLSPGRAHQGRAGPGWAGRVRARAPGGAALPIADKGRPADHVVRREEVRLVFPAGLWSGGCGAMRGYPAADGCEPR